MNLQEKLKLSAQAAGLSDDKEYIMDAKLSRNGVTATTLKVAALLLLTLLAKTEGARAQEIAIPLVLSAQGQEIKSSPSLQADSNLVGAVNAVALKHSGSQNLTFGEPSIPAGQKSPK